MNKQLMIEPPKQRHWSVRTYVALSSLAALALLPILGMFLRTNSGGEEPSAVAGVSHIHDVDSQVPWSIHIVKIDRSRKDLTFFAPLARGKILGVSRISEMARSLPAEIGQAIAAVNGDFYERDNPTYAGDPRGLQIVNGELVSAPSTVCVWFDNGSNPHVGEVKGDFKITWPDKRRTSFGLNQQRLPNMAVLYTPTYGASTRVNGGRDLILEPDTSPWLPLEVGQTYHARVREVRPSTNTSIPAGAMLLSLGPQFMMAKPPDVSTGAVLEISTAVTPDLKGVKVAIAGDPILVDHGKPFSATSAPSGTGNGWSSRSKYERHPRSCVGWNATHIFLVTVDGRQPGLSVGMTLAELGEYLVKLGCTDGMNFDGGASASLWMAGRILNNPCQGERPVANSLVVVRKPATHAAN